MILTVNGDMHTVEVENDMPLLWVLRDELGLTGTKYGCGNGDCGACIVHLDRRAARSCEVTALEASKVKITTIEGLGEPENLHPVQWAWIESQASQCGYCQTGQIMQAAHLLNENLEPSDAEIDLAMDGILCRCGAYSQVRTAVKLAAELMRES